MTSSVEYTPLDPGHFEQVITLGNEVHGDNYLSMSSIKHIYQKSWHHNINASWVALQNQQIVGFRLTYAHSQWQPDKWCSPEKWPVDAEKVCYFKCNTVSPLAQKQGIGSRLLQLSIERAAQQGAQAGLAHIWLASPGNSAYRYFVHNGGQLIKEHPNKWRHDSLYEGYVCPVCPGPCECTAAEMMLRFK
ncbi:N-acetyltransferase [Alteromonas aestuariivivens]|uniref:N-acetyltransferase n=1 Tax=Alteromonas aestuariivivens TaxID=1938339 RepID=A0A3D8MFJ8_9ALTE|nr:GNAT family N-acetyltransferase [Alteromonas aestuariivivens]RDV28978.1 N-acetyltransferase [Alteromonas aestuariivivens]